MTTERALTVHEERALTITEVMEVAKTLAASGFFADAKQPAQAVAKILAGRELGFPPVYSLRKVYLVQGQVQIAAEMMAALVKRSGKYDYRVKEHTEKVCVLTFMEHGKPVYESRYTYDEAVKAGVALPRSGWDKYPRAMLFSRALSQGARIVCPEVIGGVYTPEEFGIPVDEEGQPRVDTSTGEIIEGASRRVEPDPIDEDLTEREQKSEKSPLQRGAPMPVAAAVGSVSARTAAETDWRAKQASIPVPKTEAEWATSPASDAQKKSLLNAGVKAGLTREQVTQNAQAAALATGGVLQAGTAQRMEKAWLEIAAKAKEGQPQ